MILKWKEKSIVSWYPHLYISNVPGFRLKIYISNYTRRGFNCIPKDFIDKRELNHYRFMEEEEEAK